MIHLSPNNYVSEYMEGKVCHTYCGLKIGDLDEENASCYPSDLWFIDESPRYNFVDCIACILLKFQEGAETVL